MAANKFATMLHRNTNKITLILIYAALEWILIFLLLLNSLFSYLIIKYAEFFGLKPPCPWCGKLDQILDSAKGGKNLNRDLLCEAHSKEISKLGYCTNHQKLCEIQEMCEDCLSSRPELKGSSKNLTLFPWVKVGENNGEDVVSLNCSCCGVSLNKDDNNIYGSYLLLKSPSWDVLECAQKDNLIADAGDYLDDDNHIKKVLDFGANLCDDEKVLENRNEGQILAEFDSSCVEVNGEEKEENCSAASVSVNGVKELEGGEVEKVDEGLEMEEKREFLKEENRAFIMTDKSVQVCFEEYSPLEISPKHLEFFLDFSGHKLVPVELIDSLTEENNGKENVEAELGDMEKDQDLCLDSDIRVETKEELVDVDINEVPKFAVLESMGMEEDANSLVFHGKEFNLLEDFEQFTVFPASQFPSSDADNNVEEPAGAAGDMHSDVHSACEDVAALANNENEADVSIGTEIPDLDAADEMQNQESVHSYEFTHEDPFTISANAYEPDDHCSMQVEEQMVEFQSFSVNVGELNEIEEDKVPDTPTSTDSLNQLHKRLMFLDKRDSGAEESVDGSVTSELDGGDGVVTIEGLKSALRAERKALHVLYAELEEERSASAVAASQTMAMINRLQEEKAAMQMEALQYQRMMEEQSEYDQEAMQLLNELMVKREKEKQELEKELEVYRRKLLEHETRERMRMVKKSKDGSTRSGFSSASCSNAEDSDGMSIDLNQEAKEEEGFYSHQEYVNHNSTPVGAVVNLEESLADFEDERLSILEHLKVLEEKLVTLDDPEEPHFEDVRPIENSDEENGNHVEENGYYHGEPNGHGNGFLNGKHQTRRIPGQKGRSLLPLFDAISDENGDMVPNGNGNGAHFHESMIEMEKKKVAVEEEVDHLYERLQALEADREFLKHCISSLKKGDKGMDLLQEILQHLRDLRNVELHVRNLSDGSVI